MNNPLDINTNSSATELSRQIAELCDGYTLEEVIAATGGNMMAALERQQSPTEKRIAVFHVKKCLDTIVARSFSDENVNHANGKTKPH